MKVLVGWWFNECEKKYLLKKMVNVKIKLGNFGYEMDAGVKHFKSRDLTEEITGL
ncbi:MAG: hypothetical protein U5N85_01225 [Arcicella sp.]|nr:hypothetical protein [Arcicella sp.]